MAALCNRAKIVLFERWNTSLQILSQAKKARYPYVMDAFSFLNIKYTYEILCGIRHFTFSCVAISC